MSQPLQRAIFYRSGRKLLPIALAIAACSVPATGQGTSGASIQGVVVTSEGTPLSGAFITLTEGSTGFVREATTLSGRFLFDNLPVGGPYVVKARLLGFSPAQLDSVFLHLGDRMNRRLVLRDLRAQSLGVVEVRESDLRNAGAGGPAYSIPGAAVRNLPLRNRDFVSLFGIAPQATGSSSLSVSGQHAKFNAIQIDGGASNDFFGVNVTPGLAAGVKAISLEALDEIRILVAPFDVRQGGFSGGLINAVTRSGTNRLGGSVFTSHSRAELVGRDTAGAAVGAFSVLQYGATVGGPIIADRVHFFATLDAQSSQKPFAGQSVTNVATGISESTARRTREIFIRTYGFDPGGPEAPVLHQPTLNVFAKVSGQASRHHWLELSHSLAQGSSDGLNRIVGSRDAWQLSGSGSTREATNLTTRLRMTSALGRTSNEFLVSSTRLEFSNESRNRVPVFLVQADATNAFIAAGSTRGTQGTETGQRIFEITDNFTWTAGSHLVTVGTQNQFVRTRDNFFLGSWGAWTFGSVDSLEQRLPRQYEVTLPIRSGGPFVDYRVAMVAGYLQDQWSPTSRLTLTAGIRGDVPFSNSPAHNPLLARNVALGNIDTGIFPSGNGVLSPRLGFSLVMGADRNALLRGGVGGFAGRPPLVWLANAFANTGQEQTLLTCRSREGVPAPTTDIGNLPTRCLTSQPGSAAVPAITFVDSTFRFQQAVKYALGLDRRLGNGISASVDIIHTRTRNHLFVSDVNLIEERPSAEGRSMYGEVTASGVSRPRRVETTFGPVFRFQNRSEERSTSISAVATRTWKKNAQLHIGYDWSRTEDLMSLVGNSAIFLFQRTPIDGTIANRRLATSARDIPHNLIASVILPMRYGLTLAAFSRARSGTPYAYVISGDGNADGTTLNDLAYIPRDARDLSLGNPAAYDALDAFIESEPCLREQRGRIMRRGSCRNPPVTNLDLRVGKTFRLQHRKSMEITTDIFNFPNLLSRNWGLIRETSSGEDKQGLLTIAGWDAAANRPRYIVAELGGKPLLPSRNAVLVDPSRWRMQIGARFGF